MIGPRARGASQRGLTLIEVAMATAVTAILGTLAYGAMFATISTQEQSLFIQDRFHAGRITLERMRRELTMAFVSLHQSDDKRTITLFEGDRDSITFNTSAHEPLARNARQSDQLELGYRVAMTTNEAGDRVRALMRRVKFHIDDRPGRGGREEIVVEHVRGLELEYFDPHRERWQRDWKVRIDDAAEMRIRLQEVKQLREQLQDAASDSGTDALTALAAGAVDQELDAVLLDVIDGLLLPSRVRLRLLLEDPGGPDIVMETMVEIPMTDPLFY